MGAMDQAGRAGQAALPFKLGWWAADLGAYRPCDGTYCFSSYESLPPLPPLDGSLSWLGALPDTVDQQMEPHRNDAQARLREQADRLGLVLPGAYLRLMGSPELQDRIPSCTACYFEFSQQIMPSPDDSGGYLVRFMNDQQLVFAWYLYLTPAGDHCVLVSSYDLDGGYEFENEDKNEDESEVGDADRPDLADPAQRAQAIHANTWVCAPSFEAFIYRFWLENVLWFKLNASHPAPLAAEEQRYLAHYGLRNGETRQ